jgi:hypothetical protein
VQAASLVFRIGCPVFVVLLGACGRKSAETSSPAPAVASAVSAGSAPAGTSSAGTATTSSAFALQPFDPVLRTRVVEFFAKYQDGSDFSFLRAACASPVERFVTAKNAEVGTLIASARRFFKDKRGLRYEPDVKAMRVDRDGDRTVARLPLTMIWGVHTPPDWTPSYGALTPDAGSIDPLRDGLVEHSANVAVEIAFDAAGKIVRYVEGSPHETLLRFHAEEHCLLTDDDPGVPVIALADGAIVTDLGDRYITQQSPKGPQVIRHVLLRGGGDVWVNDSRAFAVENRFGGTSAGLADCLTLVADGGR